MIHFLMKKNYIEQFSPNLICKCFGKETGLFHLLHLQTEKGCLLNGEILEKIRKS